MLKATEIPMSSFTPEEIEVIASIAMMRVTAKRVATSVSGPKDAENASRLFGTWMQGRLAVRMLGSRRVERHEEMRRLLKATSYREVTSAVARIKYLDQVITNLHDEVMEHASNASILTALIH